MDVKSVGMSSQAPARLHATVYAEAVQFGILLRIRQGHIWGRRQRALMDSAPADIETDNPYGLCSGRRMTEKPHLSSAEAAACDAIRAKDRNLRAFLSSNELAQPIEPLGWLQYLTNLKHTLGNLNNNVGFVATLLVKAYLERRFAITDFDAGAKAQGAAGIDIVAKTGDGKMIVGELKTTKPYQPGFGAQQRTTILKDLNRLARTTADHRLMFVIDPETFRTLCGKNFSSRAPGVEVVDLITGQTFLCP